MLDLVGADVLGDAAALGRDDVGLADRVQQRRLAVVDVAQDRDDRRAQRELARIDVFLVDDVALDRTDLDVDVELVGDQLGRGRIEQLVDHLHHAELDERLDHLARLAAHLLGQLGHRHRLRHAHELALDLDPRRGRFLDEDRCGRGGRDGSG